MDAPEEQFTRDVEVLSKHRREVVEIAVHAADLPTAIGDVMSSFAVSREAATFALRQPLRMYLGCFTGHAQPWTEPNQEP